MDLIVPAIVVVGIATFLLPALLGHGVLLDVDLISSRLPYRAVTGAAYQDAITCRQDTIDYLPAIANIKYGLLHGELPSWAPWEVGGAPLAGLPNTGIFSPLALPYFVLPLWLAPAFVKLFEIVAAIVGMVAFLRRRGVSWAGAWVAGFVFATSGFMIMWSNWPQTRVAALIPLLLWASDRMVDMHRAKDVVVLAVVFAAMLLGGFPAVTMYTLLLAGPYVLIRVWQRYRFRWRDALGVIGSASVALVLGAGLASVQMAPFVANISTVFSGRNKGGGHLPLSAAVTLVVPDARGNCRGGIWYGDVIPIEAVGYVGCGAIVLAILAVAVWPRAKGLHSTMWWLFGSFVVGGWLIWVGGPLLQAFAHLPVVGNNSITRAQSVLGFVVACLAAFGFDELQNRTRDAPSSVVRSAGVVPGSPPRKWWRAIMVVAGSVVLGTLIFLTAIADAQRNDYLGHLIAAVAWPAFLLLVSIAVVGLAYLNPRSSTALGSILLVLLIVAQGTVFARMMLPLSQRDLFFPETSTHEFLQQNLGQDRYGAGDNTADASLADWYRLRTATGHEFTDSRWKDLLVAVDPHVQRTVSYSRFDPALPFAQVANSAILDRLAVRYWTASPLRAVGTVERVDRQGRTPISGAAPATCEIDSGPIRGVNLYLSEKIPPSPPRTKPILHVQVTSRGLTRAGAVLLDGTAPGPGRVTVAVAGEDLPAGGKAKVRAWLTGTEETRYFAGSGDGLSCSRVVPNGDTDKVRLVSSDAEGAIYERLDALPRIRWASHSRVVSPDKQVAALKTGLPDDTVLLDDDSTSPAGGGSGSVAIVADEGSRITLATDSTKQGYVVLADSIVRPGWTARVDGQPAPLVRGDHALATVPVAAGRHQLELTYTTPGLFIGTLTTVISTLLAASLVIIPTLSARRRRRLGRGTRGRVSPRIDTAG